MSEVTVKIAKSGLQVHLFGVLVDAANPNVILNETTPSATIKEVELSSSASETFGAMEEAGVIEVTYPESNQEQEAQAPAVEEREDAIKKEAVIVDAEVPEKKPAPKKAKRSRK